MAKLLNLDELEQIDYTLKLKGQEYPMVDISVGDFIKITKMTETLDENMPISAQMEKTVELIQVRFPTVPKEELMSLNMDQLAAVLKFSRQAGAELEGEAAKEKDKSGN